MRASKALWVSHSQCLAKVWPALRIQGKVMDWGTGNSPGPLNTPAGSQPVTVLEAFCLCLWHLSGKGTVELQGQPRTEEIKTAILSGQHHTDPLSV